MKPLRAIPARSAASNRAGIGPILACSLLVEIGEARRFRRAEQITRLAGLDPVVEESGESRRRGHLAKAGSPQLRWALVEAETRRPRAAVDLFPSLTQEGTCAAEGCDVNFIPRNCDIQHRAALCCSRRCAGRTIQPL